MVVHQNSVPSKNMKIKISYKYEMPYIPPRCRKVRYREEIADCVLNIPVVTPDDAPIAFRHGDVFRGTVEYRLYKGKLYRRIRWDEKVCGKTGFWPFEEFLKQIQDRNTWSCVKTANFELAHSEVECKKALRAKYREYLLIQNETDIEVWQRTGEPRYVIITFGLGHNHASTNYFIETSYNNNISKSRYFTALQHDAAVKEALQVAARRGDTDSFQSILNGPVIEVLIPEAVKCNPAKEAGKGDPFMNQLEAMIDGSSSANDAAVTAIAIALLNK